MYPTLEAVVTETPARLRKVMRPDVGIALVAAWTNPSPPPGPVSFPGQRCAPDLLAQADDDRQANQPCPEDHGAEARSEPLDEESAGHRAHGMGAVGGDLHGTPSVPSESGMASMR